ncbi:MAG: hypothetical protein M3401_11855 [Actinomycetota bacterium]|nr:hypothetical protein [Actinomycetota bacterium]
MPTKRPRITVTETPVLARRLQLAAARFPEHSASRAELLLRLTEVAERALVHEGGAGDGEREAAKRRLLERTQTITFEAGETMIATREADWQHELY